MENLYEAAESYEVPQVNIYADPRCVICHGLGIDRLNGKRCQCVIKELAHSIIQQYIDEYQYYFNEEFRYLK